MARICVLVLAAFTLFWGPYCVFWLTRVVLIELDRPLDNATTLHVRLVLFNIAALNCCVNPIVYGIAWSGFRQTLLQVKG